MTSEQPTGEHAPAAWTPAGLGESSLAVHAGRPPAEAFQPPLPGPVFAAHYHLPGEPVGPYRYGRDENPTWTGLEAAVARLESPGAPAETVAFGSGMGAISAVLLGLVAAGDTVVLPSDCYQVTRALAERLESFGVTVRLAPTTGDAQLGVVEGARLLWIESPSNPELEVCDIRRLADAAHAAGAIVAVDNTLATPLGQRPLDLGADLSVSSGTKALAGHADVLLGYVTARDPELAARVRAWRKVVGAIPGPMEAWLAHRSLATLALRVDRQAVGALALAEALLERPEVTGVRHPGLPGDPSHAVAARQMRRFGCVVSFELPDRAHAERFLGALRLAHEATSFGSVLSSAERRRRWGGDAVPEGFVRFSVGVEDPEDIVADVLRALDRAAATTAATAEAAGGTGGTGGR
jgi:cystathionine gamma-lyase